MQCMEGECTFDRTIGGDFENILQVCYFTGLFLTINSFDDGPILVGRS